MVAITTKRLLLRPVRPEDRDAIFAVFTATVTRFMNPAPPARPEETERFLVETIARMARGEELVCAVTDPETGDLLGCAGVHQLQKARPELGVWIREDAWGHGYGLEAVRAIRDWARARTSATSFLYPVDQSNGASRRLAEKLGGTCQGGPRAVPTADGRTLHLLDYEVPS